MAKNIVTAYINNEDHEHPGLVQGNYIHYYTAPNGTETSEQLFFKTIKTKNKILKTNNEADALRDSFMARFNYLSKVYKNTTVKLQHVNLCQQYLRTGEKTSTDSSGVDFYSTNQYARKQNAAAIIAFDTEVVFVEVHNGIMVEQYFGEQIKKSHQQSVFKDNCLELNIDVPALNQTKMVNFHGNTKINLEMQAVISMDLNNGDHPEQIAKRYDISLPSVYKVKNELNITVSPKQREYELVKSLLAEGLSVAEVSRRTGKSRTFVNARKAELA